MKTPKQILDKRYARGEISVGEYQQLSQSIDNAEQGSQTMQLPNKSTSPWPWIGGIAGGLFLVLILIGYISSNKLVLGQIEASSSGFVEFRLANPTSNSGDIVLYIIDDGIRKCEHITHMGADTAREFRFNCVIVAPQFEIRAEWAYATNIGNIATRI